MNIYDFFESVDIIVDAKLQNLKLDRTILCTVVDVTEKQYGKYGVMYENSRFFAHCTDLSLNLNDLVYVGVPQNDYTNAFIISKKLNEVEITHQVNPHQYFYKLIEYSQSESSPCIIDKDNRYNKVIWKSSEQDIQNIYDINKYDYMGIEATFVSTCQQKYKGVYGLKVYIKTRESEGDGESYYDALYEHAFTSDSMLVTEPYVFSGESVQKALFDIKDINTITGVGVVLYCDDNVFDESLVEEILVKNLKISFGFNLQEFTQPSLEIYIPQNNLLYSASGDSANKTMYAKWLFKDNDVLKAITYHNAPVEFKLTGAQCYWERYSNNQWVIEAQYIDGTGTNPFIFTDSLNVYKKEEKYRCRILYSVYNSSVPLEYISNILTFTNTENSEYTDILQELKIITNNTSFTDIYNSNGQIVDRNLILQVKQIEAQATIKNLTIVDLLTKNPDYFIEVQWRLPIGDDSMIVYPENFAQLIVDDIYTIRINNENINEEAEYWKIQQNQINFYIPFKLQEYYTLSRKNNNTFEITISIKQNTEIIQQDKTSLQLHFSKSGVCETDYVIQLEMYNLDGQKVGAIKPGETVRITAHLYDYLGNKVDALEGFSWEWYSSPQQYLDIDKTIVNQNYEFLTLHDADSSTCSLTANAILYPPTQSYNQFFDAGYILQARFNIKKVNDDVVVKQITEYLPIAINTSYDTGYRISNISGPSKIVYNSLGVAPSYYQTPYKAYDRANNEMLVDWISTIYGISPELNTSSLHDIFTYLNFEQLKQYYPKVIKQGDQGFELAPVSMYITNANKSFCLLGYQPLYSPLNNNESALALPLWIQPIMIQQTKSFSSYINDWDGSFKLDESNNSLLSARLGAGKKNEDDGSFSGVLLGDWTEQFEDGSLASTPQTGIYGISHGIQSYGFREDGTAFIGKDSEGRINFNGNDGLIYSSNFDGSYFTGQLENGQPIFTNKDSGYDGPISYNIDGKMQWATDKNQGKGTKGTFINLKSGEMIVNDGYFRGDIYAKSLTLKTGEQFDADNYVSYTRDEETGNARTIYVPKTGLLRADNAIITGNIYATDGEFNGTVRAKAGHIGESSIITSTNPGFVVEQEQNVYDCEFTLTKDDKTEYYVAGTHLPNAYVHILKREFKLSDLPEGLPDIPDNNYIVSVTDLTTSYYTEWSELIPQVLLISSDAEKFTLEAIVYNRIPTQSAIIEVPITFSLTTVKLSEPQKISYGTFTTNNNSFVIHSSTNPRLSEYSSFEFKEGYGAQLDAHNINVTDLHAGEWRIQGNKIELQDIILQGRNSQSSAQDMHVYNVGNTIFVSLGSLWEDLEAFHGAATDLFIPVAYKFNDSNTYYYTSVTIPKGQSGGKQFVKSLKTVTSVCFAEAINQTEESTRTYKQFRCYWPYLTINRSITPLLNKGASLGFSNKQWNYIYGANIHGDNIVNGTDVSDERLKNSIENLPECYELFYDQLQPVRYKYNNGTSNRYHTGFIAQQVLQSLETAELTTQDFAGICLNQAHDTEKMAEDYWYMRRDEFVALNTWQIQKLKKQIKELQQELQEIKQSLKENENNK